MGLDEILLDAPSRAIGNADSILSGTVVLLGGEQIPFGCFAKVLRDTRPIGIELSEIALGLRKSLFCDPSVAGRGLTKAERNGDWL